MTVRVCAITGRDLHHHLSIIMPNLPFSVFACYELNLDLHVARGYIISLIKLAQLVNICCDR